MNRTSIKLLAFCSIAMSVFTACQSNDVDNDKDNNTAQHIYTIKAESTAAQDSTIPTKALAVDANNKKVLHSEWAQGDKVIAFVSDDGVENNSTTYSMIESVSKAKSSLFTGQIKAKGNRAIKPTDDLCFFYPGAAVGNSIAPVKKTGEDDKKPYHDEVSNISNLLALNLTRQDGTAETIGKLYDFQYKKVKPKSIEGSTINVSIGDMKRIVSLWGLRFTDANNHILTNIDSVYISNVKGSDVFDLSTGGFVANNPADESMNIVVTPPTGQKVSSAGGKYTYISLLPGTYTNVLIMVYVGNKCYKKEYASLTFDEGKIYHSDLLSMPEVLPEPYVEVQGIRWATGNFIHYGPETGGYWGIAPAQWWISRRAVMLGSNRKPVSSGGTIMSSQFEDNPTQTTDDVDLFRYATIVNALKLRMADYKAKNTDVAKTFWNNDRPLITQEVDRSQAKYGDIVWYHTMNNHKKYRMPSKNELKTLYTDATSIPAYCYTDQKTIVYGAYFTTHTAGTTRRVGFPTKVRDYYKYSNVTALVRANKGLFLPITGRRVTGIADIGLRDMTWGLGAVGQYMSSESSLADYVFSLVFGPKNWNFDGYAKGQASAIRPVLDSDDKQKDPVFPDFSNIR